MTAPNARARPLAWLVAVSSLVATLASGCGHRVDETHFTNHYHHHLTGTQTHTLRRDY